MALNDFFGSSHAADAAAYQRTLSNHITTGGSGALPNQYAPTVYPTPMPVVVGGPDSAEAKQEIGEYFTRFVSYGLVPTVTTESGRWVVTLESLDGDDYSMTIKGQTLVNALRQADMAAGGWFAQREIEQTAITEDATSKTMTVENIRDLLQKFDAQNISCVERCIVLPPGIAKTVGIGSVGGTLFGAPVVVDRTAPKPYIKVPGPKV